MTTDNTATTWRDLTDKLTEEQITDLTALEKVYRNAPEADRTLLAEAQEHAEGNRRLGHVPAPVGAVRLYQWQHDPEEDGLWRREFEGREWKVGPVAVVVGGHQRADGSALASMFVYGGDGANLTNVEARRLAAVMVEAADEVDRIIGETPPFM